MHLSTLSEWLSWIENIHSTEIDLSLDRVKLVADRLNVLPPNCPVITVGGTNGKGSTVFGLEAIYRAAHYRTGVFTSPYLLKYNEQVRINGQEIDDQILCKAFAKIEEVRGEIPLTPFEFCTLASLSLFQSQVLDVLILEVGLGGRLDAVNVINANVAIVTSIGIDHVAWLGSSREQIAYEKAGIFRSGQPAICGDFDPPTTLIETAKKIGAPFYCQGRDFHYHASVSNWSWSDHITQYKDLPFNSLAIQNMSVVLMAVTLLQNYLPITQKEIEKGLKNVNLPGRIQIIPGPVMKIFDVSHNPAAITWLKEKINSIPCSGKKYAVFSMLSDKDMMSSVLSIKDSIDIWHVAPLQTKRTTTEEVLKKSFQETKVDNVIFYHTIAAAYNHAIKITKPGDCLIVFGSFHTVAEVWKWMGH
ncbi:MAG: bifunctional tetrahydrofolate synthase/dihydrofolate synthase [Gammaproteobacteria bacterium]|nr:bifunctional tetrahydrofolate synthase/dihydrofolate synthase [Gammaproteobacteria bacterium]MCW5582887.1 bifunctional tetrahydrofolate synthase/dihydrofolate synthase [Gammaproteobacteria bacterium]